MSDEDQVKAVEQADVNKDAAADLRELAGTERSTAGFLAELRQLAVTYGAEFVKDLVDTIEKERHSPAVIASLLHGKANELDPPPAEAGVPGAAEATMSGEMEGGDDEGSHGRRRRR